MGPDHLLKAIHKEKDFGRKTSFEIKLQEMECPKESIQGHTQEETQTLMRYCCRYAGKHIQMSILSVCVGIEIEL